MAGKIPVALLIFFYSLLSFSQPLLPFYYEQNLPLYGQPLQVAEYYYEYHTQAKAHYYNHTLEYDTLGRIKTHIKSNKELLNPDSIPLTFKDIIDPRAITITYSFTYDAENRLSYFSRHQYQEQVGAYQQDEAWKYDAQGMLTEHNFLEIDSADTTLKNPSTRRTIYRDSSGKVQKIEKYTYSFSARGLVLSEIVEYMYNAGMPDTIVTYQVNNGATILKEKRYDISFEHCNALNTDSLLFRSYTSEDPSGQLTLHSYAYDAAERMVLSLTTTDAMDTVTKSVWVYEPLKVIEVTDGDSLVTYYDETGYERYHEEFSYGSSLGVPADMNTRGISNGRIEHALLEVWDPVTLFYRKDTEYVFSYDAVTAVQKSSISSVHPIIYPNPSSGTIFLNNVRTEDIVSLELISSDGRSVVLEPGNILHVNAARGIYILRISYKDASFSTNQIVIE